MVRPMIGLLYRGFTGITWPFVAIFRLFRRRPGACLGGLALIALISFAVVVRALQAWADYHLEQARVAVARGYSGEAEQHLARVFQVREKDPEAILLAARVSRRRGAFDISADFLDRYLAIRGRTDEVVFERALLTAAQGNVDEVGKFLEKTLTETPSLAPLAYEALVQGASRTFRLQKASQWLDSWQEADPDNPQVPFQRGQLADRRQMQQEGASAYRQVLRLDPQRDDARLRLCDLLLDMGQGHEAMEHLRYLATRPGDEAHRLVATARAQDQVGEQEEAIRLLDNVLARWPDLAPALFERGRLALRTRDLERAESLLTRAHEKEPTDPQTIYQLSLVLRERGKIEQAREIETRGQQIEADLRRIEALVGREMEQEPRNAELRYEAAMIALRAGVIPEALRWFYQALDLNPRHVRTHAALAEFFQRNGEVAKAAHHRAQAGKPDSERK